MVHRSRLLLLCIGLLCAISPALPAGSEFGINGVGWIHYRDQPDALKIAGRRMADLKALGADWDRVELWWGVVEPEPGRFEWEFPDRVIRFYQKHGVKPLVILSYASAWSNGNAPADAAERERFGRYVYEMVRRYKGTVRAWEVWNEPNIPTFWSPAPDAEAYAELLKVAYREAKRADPRCTVLGGATSMADLNFLEEMAKHGAWRSFDALSVHPYSMAGSPTYQRLDLILESVQRLNKRMGKPKPVWITEMGWTAQEFNEVEELARNLVQAYTIAKAHGVERLFWFNLQDWSEKWGLTREDGSRKVAFNAYQAARKHLSGARFVGYLRAAPDWRRYYLVFRKGGKPVLVLWQEAVPEIPEPLALPASRPEVTDAYGANRPDLWKEGKLRVGRTPLLVTGVSRRIFRRVVSRRPLDPAQNLLANPGFTGSDATPWAWNRGRHEGTGADATFEVISDGDRRWLHLGPSMDGAWDHVPLPVEPGQRYRLTVRARSENATGQNFASLYWWNAVGWGYQGQSDTPALSGNWGGKEGQILTVEATVPEGAYYLRLNFVSRNNTGAVRFSEPSLVKLR